ncbi:hypothetical protein [Nocardia sp. XZ_19_385]|uniref:hypothetical protein n=1 Tax=Nocardia sp. XZ_19_385 TaxID=2769488 RepID=UPI00188EF2D5|nr:hypothetical protein [Nocardia sp. XZ_19_385]
MNFRRTTAAAALVIGAMTVGMGTTHADPAAPAPAELKYSVKLVDKTVVAKLLGGTFELSTTEEPAADPADKPKITEIANIKDETGALVMSLPMKFDVAGIEIPVKPVVKEDGTVLELLTERPANLPANQVANTVNIKSVASPIEDQRAMNNFSTQFGLATAVGGFVGTAVGVVVGGIIGCILGLPLLGIGCIPAAVAGAGIGGILGTVAIGGPALAIAGMDLLETLQAAPGNSKWSDQNMNANQPK